MTQFQGVLPAVVTPLDSHGRFAPEPFERLLSRLYAAGIDGVYVGGQTGEGLFQTPDQRKLAIDVAVRCSPPGKIVMAHIGAHRVDEAVELARHAERAGASAVSSLPPIGAFPFSEIRRYYEKLTAASGLPFFVYYFPELCPAITNAGQLLELFTLPNVVGAKFTDFDLYKLWILRSEGAIIFNGRDEVFAAGLLMGANGGIGSFYNLVPEWFLQVHRLGQARRWEEARAVQGRINALIRLTLQFPAMAALKRMLAWTGIDCGQCLEPRFPLTQEQERSLRQGLARLELPEAMAAVQ